MSESIHDLLIVWSVSAQKAFLDTLERIENEDVGTARLVLQRVEKSMSLFDRCGSNAAGQFLPGTGMSAMAETKQASLSSIP